MPAVLGSKWVRVQLHPGPEQFPTFLTTKIFANFFHEVSQLVLPDFPIGYCIATEMEEKKIGQVLTSFDKFWHVLTSFDKLGQNRTSLDNKNFFHEASQLVHSLFPQIFWQAFDELKLFHYHIPRDFTKGYCSANEKGKNLYLNALKVCQKGTKGDCNLTEKLTQCVIWVSSNPM